MGTQDPVNHSQVKANFLRPDLTPAFLQTPIKTLHHTHTHTRTHTHTLHHPYPPWVIITRGMCLPHFTFKSHSKHFVSKTRDYYSIFFQFLYLCHSQFTQVRLSHFLSQLQPSSDKRRHVHHQWNQKKSWMVLWNMFREKCKETGCTEFTGLPSNVSFFLITIKTKRMPKFFYWPNLYG